MDGWGRQARTNETGRPVSVELLITERQLAYSPVLPFKSSQSNIAR